MLFTLIWVAVLCSLFVDSITIGSVKTANPVFARKKTKIKESHMEHRVETSGHKSTKFRVSPCKTKSDPTLLVYPSFTVTKNALTKPALRALCRHSK